MYDKLGPKFLVKRLLIKDLLLATEREWPSYTTVTIVSFIVIFCVKSHLAQRLLTQCHTENKNYKICSDFVAFKTTRGGGYWRVTVGWKIPTHTNPGAAIQPKILNSPANTWFQVKQFHRCWTGRNKLILWWISFQLSISAMLGMTNERLFTLDYRGVIPPYQDTGQLSRQLRVTKKPRINSRWLQGAHTTLHRHENRIEEKTRKSIDPRQKLLIFEWIGPNPITFVFQVFNQKVGNPTFVGNFSCLITALTLHQGQKNPQLNRLETCDFYSRSGLVLKL